MDLTKKITIYTLSYSPVILTLLLFFMTFLLYFKIGIFIKYGGGISWLLWYD